MIKFGPLLPNQVVQLRTDNTKWLIVDMTSTPATAEELIEYRRLADLESFGPIGNIAATVQANASAFEWFRRRGTCTDCSMAGSRGRSRRSRPAGPRRSATSRCPSRAAT